MKIPPVSGPNFHNPQRDPIVDQFNDLWNKWYQNPTRKNGEKLLDFIKEHHDEFEKIASEKNQPHPKVPFDHSFEAAVKTLQAWLDQGCDPDGKSAPSEFITDVAKWING